MKSRKVAVLGATGSIGRATLEVLDSLGDGWEAYAVSAHRGWDRLREVAIQAKARHAVLSSVPDSSQEPPPGGDWPASVQKHRGPSALAEIARDPQVDTVVAAIVGRAGVESTLAALESGKRVALANKETLVCAGPIVEALLWGDGQDAAEADQPRPLASARLLPVDSEHSAIFQCLPQNFETTDSLSRDSTRPIDSHEPRPLNAHSVVPPRAERDTVQRLILTASGGPFREANFSQMREATVQQALAHPTWKMGRKISIDSATMMNKALELIEARWLFGFSSDQLAVMVHPQSIVHSMVEYVDGSVLSQMSPPDMKLPIQFALTFPERTQSPAASIDRTKPWELTFHPVDEDLFPAIPLGFEVARAGGTAGSVVNAANEAAVDLFLNEKIRFTDIVPACRAVLEHHTFEARPSLDRLLKLDKWARAEVGQWSLRRIG